MVIRRRHPAAVLLAVALVPASALAGITGSRGSPSSVYSLRADPRMCPSPMCGGFWVSRVNLKVAPCLQGAGLPACYAASVDLSALAPAPRVRARSVLASGRALVEGGLARYSTAYAQLARLVATQVWLSAAAGQPQATVYRVVDTGIRCIRAPCFSLRATVANGTRSLTLSRLDLTTAGVPPATIARARELLTHGGVLVSGTIRTLAGEAVTTAGRTFVATRLWLPA